MEWEYYTLRFKVSGFFSQKIDTAKIDAALNEAGREGWELVNGAVVGQTYGGVSELLFFFKRQTG